ncbi:hypothetical protein GO755_39640 [Spirosoma sp. HMF4905]|uniref:PH domain-containing protein n=1 Tax=Spirosoma arboris TaxID=2682092 RepID=A0A7K1SQW8_9BACT|nr:hypothetical protein [Spirosoma arboris]MVM36191.1 hypothetical protein [Spirosoma arboris]
MKVSQIGTSTLVTLVAAALIIGWLDPTAAKPILALLGIILLLFYKLDVYVTNQHIKFVFGIGLIQRSISLDQVVGVKVVRNSIWSGWGIRVSSAFTLYTVSGLDAIELTLKGKVRTIRIGTNVPELLSAYINQKLDIISPN